MDEGLELKLIERGCNPFKKSQIKIKETCDFIEHIYNNVSLEYPGIILFRGHVHGLITTHLTKDQIDSHLLVISPRNGRGGFLICNPYSNAEPIKIKYYDDFKLKTPKKKSDNNKLHQELTYEKEPRDDLTLFIDLNIDDKTKIYYIPRTLTPERNSLFWELIRKRCKLNLIETQEHKDSNSSVPVYLCKDEKSDIQVSLKTVRFNHVISIACPVEKPFWDLQKIIKGLTIQPQELYGRQYFDFTKTNNYCIAHIETDHGEEVVTYINELLQKFR